MKLHNFDPETGTFDYIAHDDGTPAVTFYRLGMQPTFFQVVTGGEGSVNLDAKTLDGKGDVDIGLWPQEKAGVYIQSETRPNWLKLTPSDEGGPIVMTTGGSPYTTHVGFTMSLQAGRRVKL